MSTYIAFLDLVGTRAAAEISSENYREKIRCFAQCLSEIERTNESSKCSIYGYSDNAYIEAVGLKNLIEILQLLRDRLRRNNLYFSAAVDRGALGADYIPNTAGKGSIMTFDDSAAAEVYGQQSQFQGIGISLSHAVVEDILREKIEGAFVTSLYESTRGAHEHELIAVKDIPYTEIHLPQIEFVIGDYLKTIVISPRAARYYITPIISMLKSYDLNRLESDLDALVRTLTLQRVPDSFMTEALQSHKMLFVFSLIEHLMSIEQNPATRDSLAKDIGAQLKQIIVSSKIPVKEYVHNITRMPNSVLSGQNKYRLIELLYNYEKRIKTEDK